MIVVVGAGITGLTLAWRLMREGRDVLVLDAAPRAGGVIRTVHRDGLILEQGPQTLRGGSPAAYSVIEALGLRDRVVEAHEDAKNRYVLWDGALYPVPKGLLDGRFFPKGALLRIFGEPFVRRGQRPDESIASFFARRFGTKVAERLVDPMVAGIFAGDTTRLEMASVFPEIAELEARYGSVIVGGVRGGRPKRPEGAPKTLFAFRDGMEELPSALAAALGDRLRLSTPVERIERLTTRFRVHAPGGPFDAAAVAVCVPPSRAAAFLPSMAGELAAMPSAPVAAVHLAWKAGAVPPMRGFGWLAPSSQRTDVLGCLWVSGAFPQHAPDRVMVRVMMGGARDPRLAQSPDALVERARRALREVQGIEADPVATDVSVGAIPQYEQGHGERIGRLQRAEPGLHLLGWGYTGIGVEHGIRAAQQLDIGG